MSVRSAATTTIGILAALALAALLLGGLLGQPILLSYVETGSMEPTLEPGDGFVAVPAELSGEIEEGDVVVFDAEQLHGGELTTHRVVGETEQGYVTRGDANPFTDQDSNEPHVTDGQIVATALQVNGEVVVIPGLGSAVMAIDSTVDAAQGQLAALLGTRAVLGTQGLAYLLLAFAAAVFAHGMVFDDRRTVRDGARSWSRSREGVYDGRRVVAVVALLVIAVTVGATLFAGGTHERGIVSAEFDSDRPDIVPAGETETQPTTLSNGGLLPQIVVLEPASSGVEVETTAQRLGPRESVEATMRVTAPSETGYYLRSVAEYRYFAVLPTSVVLALHAVHPWLATLATTGVIVVVVTLPLLLAVGSGTVRLRDRSRGRSGGGFG